MPATAISMPDTRRLPAVRQWLLMLLLAALGLAIYKQDGESQASIAFSVVLHAADEAVGQVRRVQTGRTTLLERVVTWDEPRVLAYTIEGLPKVVRHVRNQWTLEPTGAGAEVRLTTDVDCGPRPPQQLVARLVARRLARESDRLLDGLAVALERSHA